MHISVLNTQSAREPLSRIISLTNLISEHGDKEVRTVILPMLQKSSEELDEAPKEVIDLALNHMKNFNNLV